MKSVVAIVIGFVMCLPTAAENSSTYRFRARQLIVPAAAIGLGAAGLVPDPVKRPGSVNINPDIRIRQVILRFCKL